MGFFGNVVGGLLGGGKTSSSGGTYQSGFSSIPKELQKPYTQYGTQLSDAFANSPVQTPNTDQTKGFNLARQGIAATPESLQRDLAMLMNPYDDYVINDINRQAMGDNSLVNQFATQAGQQGSNRSFLGSSDVEQNRLNNIGKFRQDQYNTSVNNILGPLANSRQQDIGNLLGIGQQQQDMPYNNLMKYAQLLGVVPNGTNLTQTGGTTSGGGNLGSAIGNVGSIASGIGSVLGFFSDKNLKEEIEYVGERNGFPLYEFNYKGDDQRYRGVIAQDIQDLMPEAVGEEGGYLTVDYGKIGFGMEAVHG